jgi:hypothetical protein
MINDVHTSNGKNISDVLHEFKHEFRTFVTTRAQLLREEMRQKLSAIKSALPMVVIGAVLLMTAWFLITAALVTVIATAMEGIPWAYPIAFGIVAVLYLIVGGILAMMGVSALRKQGLKPEKTIRVLREDKVWLQTETSRLQA